MVIGELIRKVISLIIFDKILVERISKIKTMDDCFDFEEKFLNHHSFELREIILSLLEDEEKKAKHLSSFAIYVNEAQIYSKDQADAIEYDLRPLLANGSIIALTKHDSNPQNNPQPPAHLR